MYCPYCGEENENDSKFCSECGKPLADLFSAAMVEQNSKILPVNLGYPSPPKNIPLLINYQSPKNNKTFHFASFLNQHNRFGNQKSIFIGLTFVVLFIAIIFISMPKFIGFFITDNVRKTHREIAQTSMTRLDDSDIESIADMSTSIATDIPFNNIEDGNLVYKYDDLNSVDIINFSQDGRMLAVVSDHGKITIWDTLNKNRLQTFITDQRQLNSAFSLYRNLFTSVSEDQVNSWNIENGEKVLTQEFLGESIYAISPDGNLIIAGQGTMSDISFYQWNDATQKYSFLRKLQGVKESGCWGNKEEYVISPDGNMIAIMILTVEESNPICLWNVNGYLDYKKLKGHTDTVKSVAFSLDGQKLASGSDDKTVRVWDIPTGNLLYTLEGHTNTVRSVAFSTDGNILASGSDDNSVRVWDMMSGSLLYNLEGHINEVYSVSFSPDGQTLASGSLDDSVRIWKMETGR